MPHRPTTHPKTTWLTTGYEQEGRREAAAGRGEESAHPPAGDSLVSSSMYAMPVHDPVGEESKSDSRQRLRTVPPAFFFFLLRVLYPFLCVFGWFMFLFVVFCMFCSTSTQDQTLFCTLCFAGFRTRSAIYAYTHTHIDTSAGNALGDLSFGGCCVTYKCKTLVCVSPASPWVLCPKTAGILKGIVYYSAA